MRSALGDRARVEPGDPAQRDHGPEDLEAEVDELEQVADVERAVESSPSRRRPGSGRKARS
jgi:hypothetical protein